MAITLVGRARTKRDPTYGSWSVLEFSDGSIHNIQRQDGIGNFGMAGWHLIDDNQSTRHTWLADTEADAIAELLRRKNR